MDDLVSAWEGGLCWGWKSTSIFFQEARPFWTSGKATGPWNVHSHSWISLSGGPCTVFGPHSLANSFTMGWPSLTWEIDLGLVSFTFRGRWSGLVTYWDKFSLNYGDRWGWWNPTFCWMFLMVSHNVFKINSRIKFSASFPLSLPSQFSFLRKGCLHAQRDGAYRLCAPGNTSYKYITWLLPTNCTTSF